MGIFKFFKSKSSDKDSKQELIDKIIGRYFDGSKEKLQTEVTDLLEVTKFDISYDQMVALLLCCLGYHGVNAKWSEKILNHLKQLCSEKLPDVELKWLFNYCDLHYIHKNPGKEFILLSEMAGRQIGIPAPHEVFLQQKAYQPMHVKETEDIITEEDKDKDIVNQQVECLIDNNILTIEQIIDYVELAFNALKDMITEINQNEGRAQEIFPSKNFGDFDFQTATRKEIIEEIGVDSLLEITRTRYFDTEVSTEDDISILQEMNEIYDNWDGFIEFGKYIFYKNEGLGIIKKNGRYELINDKNQVDKRIESIIEEVKRKENEISTIVGEDDQIDAMTDTFKVKYSRNHWKLLEATSCIDNYMVDKVTRVICDNAFANCESLENINLSDSIILIGGGAFYGCKKLTSIKIPDSVKKIGEDVLSECRNLTSIVVDENNKFYDSRNDCNAIIESKSGILIAGCSSTIIPNGVKIIAHQAFGGCPIKTIDIPDCVIEIGPSAFCCCEEIASIVIPDSVEIIGQLAFCECKSLTTIKMPQGIKEIGDSVFLGCEHLESIIIPNGTKEKFMQLLPEYKDKLVEQFTSKNQSIGIENDWWTDENGMPYIIDYVSNVEGELPESLFPNEINTKRKAEEKTSDTYIDEYGVEYSSDRKILKRAPKDITDYSILDGTEIIGNAAFSNCESLISVTIPKGIKKIGHYAFASCNKIYSFVIPDGVMTIGGGSFMNCKTLTALKLPGSIISIEEDVFESCENLRTIFVPVEEKARFEMLLSKFNVKIGEYCSDNVGALDEMLNGLLDDSGVLYSKDGKKLFTHTRKLSTYTVKDGTEMICGKAFNPINGVDDCSSLKEINLPDTIVIIGEMAFAYNEELKEISLPSSIDFIGKDAFLNCKSLSTIFIPSGSRAMFEKLLPELTEKLIEKAPVEKYEAVVDHLENFELPDGSIYNGDCIRWPFGNVELSGQGEIRYNNGDNYNGEFKNGGQLGWGIYTFSNGHTHKGFFDSVPNGLGYLNEDYSMAVGYFGRDYDGDINRCRLNGWGISYRNRIFKFGYWKNGKLVKDETNNTLWIRNQISHERSYYHGKLIQIGKEHDFIRFGIPQRLLMEREPDIPVEKIPKAPAWGFEFFKDGSVKVGAIFNHDSGEFSKYYPDGTSELGKWKDNKKILSFTIDRLQKPVDEYKVDGLDVF